MTGAAVGYAGPQGRSIPVYADPEVAAIASAITGANKTDYHVRGFHLGYIQIDTGKQYPIPYQICLPNACYGELAVDDDFIKALRGGKQLTVLALSQRNQGVPFPMSLAGFTKSYDSKGLDAKAAQQRQEDLNKALQARAEEARKKLIQQQQKEGGGAAPAQ